MRCAPALALALASCSGGSSPPVSDTGPEAARTIAFGFVRALEHSDKEALKRFLSFADLARASRPAGVERVSAATEIAFVEQSSALLLDPSGAARRLVLGMEIGEASVHGDEIWVEGRSESATTRFVVGKRSGRLAVIRVE